MYVYTNFVVWIMARMHHIPEMEKSNFIGNNKTPNEIPNSFSIYYSNDFKYI